MLISLPQGTVNRNQLKAVAKLWQNYDFRSGLIESFPTSDSSVSN